jgi:hypothetical protein
MPDFFKPSHIEIDASEYGVGVVLMQDRHPIAFVSKSMGPRMRGLSTYEKEFVAILFAVDQWRAYIQFGEFCIATDQKRLSHLNAYRLNIVWQRKVFTKFIGLKYRILYKKGSENRAVDALSRRPDPEGTCNAMFVCKPKWLELVIATYTIDPYVSEIIAKLSLDDSVVPNLSWKSGLLRYKNRIWVRSDLDLQLKLIAAFHESALGDIQGFK